MELCEKAAALTLVVVAPVVLGATLLLGGSINDAVSLALQAGGGAAIVVLGIVGATEYWV